jgi:hypothetical protein
MSLSYTDAKNRRSVVLADGRAGVLLHIDRKKKQAKVRIAGRHFWVPLTGMRLAVVHQYPDAWGRMPCCGGVPADLVSGDRVSTTMSEVTCGA